MSDLALSAPSREVVDGAAQLFQRGVTPYIPFVFVTGAWWTAGDRTSTINTIG
ncbi:MAG TPA: hypothetical protein VGD48_24980 [Kutzneria sp.]